MAHSVSLTFITQGLNVRKEHGFTLIEAVIVLAIIGIMAAFAVPHYLDHRQNQQVSRAARDVYSALHHAKLTAIRDNTNILVSFNPGAGTYQVFEDLNNDNVFDAATERDIQSGQVPVTITMQPTTFSYTNTAVSPAVTTPHVTRFTSLGLTTAANGMVSFTHGSRQSQVVVGIAGDVQAN